MTASRLRPLVLAVVVACTGQPDAEPPPTTSTIAADTTTIAAETTTIAADTTTIAEVTTSVATGASMPPFPGQPEAVPWPTEEWAVAEFPAEVDKTIVDDATDLAFADGAPDRVRAVVIVHKGAIVYERYSPVSPTAPMW